MRQRLRIFISSPGDVKVAREIAALTIERLAQDYARFFEVKPYLWEYEAMIASGHFQDSIEPPSAFDIVVVILWSTLGTLLPERTSLREYRGIDGRAPLTGTEWEFEEAFHAAKQTGTPDLLVYRSVKPALFDTGDPDLLEQQLQQFKALNGFWTRHFVNQGMFTGAYTVFTGDSEFATALESHLRKLIQKRIDSLELAQGEKVTRVWAQAPFRGLEAYEYVHAPIFFGQDEALSKAMLQLTANGEAKSPFLLVLGASGSGKSSLVKAGMLPKLFVPRRIPGAAFLRRVVFRPSDARNGEDLFDALARILTTQTSEEEGLSDLVAHGQSATSLAAHLRNAAAEPGYPIGTALGHLTERARQAGRMLDYETAKLALVIDQMEELFTNERITSLERRRFVELLAGLARSGYVWVIVTMRRDFWHRANETPELLQLSEAAGRLELVPPTPSQLSQMIRRPAEAAGISFEFHGTTNVPLNEVIAEEVAREPGALPLLSYLLDQLYRADVLEAGGTTLTYATYEKLGKLAGAIATQAEAVLQRCAPEDRQALGSLLFSLVQVSTNEGDVERVIARRVPLSTFAPGTPQRRLVEALLDPSARLLVTDAEKEKGPTVRVAHEALISRWTQAREFVQSNADALKIRQRMEERYTLWRALATGTPEVTRHGKTETPKAGLAKFAGWRSRSGRANGLLLDIDLSDGRRLLDEHRTDTEPHLVEYIERSISDEKRVRTRTVRVLAAIAIVVTLLAIIATGASWIATKKQREAEYQTAETLKAQSRSLTEAASARLKEDDITYARGIILEVLKHSKSPSQPEAAAINVFQEIRARDPQLAILSGHGNAVLAAGYSPDGTRIVTASMDKTARIWDALTGIEITELSGDGDYVLSAVYSPDGTRIVTASDGTARIWDAQTGRLLVTIGGVRRSIAYSPDGTRIVTSSSSDGTPQIRNAVDGNQIFALSGSEGSVIGVAYSSDGTRIVTASSDKTARIWDARTGVQLAVLAGHTDVVETAAYSPDGTKIVTASHDGDARIWEARTGHLLAVLPGIAWRGSWLVSARYSPDGTRIVTASTDHTARIWNATTGAVVKVLSGHVGILSSAAYSPDGTRIVTASFDHTARIWSAANGQKSVLLAGHGDQVNDAAYSPDGTRIVTASDDMTARLWDTRTGTQLSLLSGHSGAVNSANYSTDGSRIITASDDETARIWDARTSAPLLSLSYPKNAFLNAAFSPDGTRIVTSQGDLTSDIWDARTGARLLVLSGHRDYVPTVAYSPDGSRIVTASLDKTARIWDSRSGVQLAILSKHGDFVYSAAYSLDGTRIVTGSADRTARVWNARTGAQIAVLYGHRGRLDRAVFSPGGSRIATASADRTVRIWDAATGTQLAVLNGHEGSVNSVAYSPDGTHVVTASADKTVRIWDARPPADLPTQITWEESVESDPLSDVERAQLGLPLETHSGITLPNASECDRVAGALYDPDRRAPGVEQASINADISSSTCSRQTTASDSAGRLVYQEGRAMLAKGDIKAARRDFEQAVSEGYRAARVDLANLLVDRAAGILDPERSVLLYERAWQDGVSAAAFRLGRLYEDGFPRTAGSAIVASGPDLAKSWSWYQKGADSGEPNALARFAVRCERSALAETSPQKRDALLLKAFAFYASAAQRANDEDWPDDAWRHWRYRRATLGRFLAGEDMMQQVADTLSVIRGK